MTTMSNHLIRRLLTTNPGPEHSAQLRATATRTPLVICYPLFDSWLLHIPSHLDEHYAGRTAPPGIASLQRRGHDLDCAFVLIHHRPEPDKVIQCLDLSNDHLPQPYSNVRTSPGVAICALPYGYWLDVPTDPDQHPDIAEPIARILRYARLHGCDHILFDRDADTTPELPEYDS